MYSIIKSPRHKQRWRKPQRRKPTTRANRRQYGLPFEACGSCSRGLDCGCCQRYRWVRLGSRYLGFHRQWLVWSGNNQYITYFQYMEHAYILQHLHLGTNPLHLWLVLGFEWGQNSIWILPPKQIYVESAYVPNPIPCCIIVIGTNINVLFVRRRTPESTTWSSPVHSSAGISSISISAVWSANGPWVGVAIVRVEEGWSGAGIALAGESSQ